MDTPRTINIVDVSDLILALQTLVPDSKAKIFGPRHCGDCGREQLTTVTLDDDGDIILT